MKNIEATKRIVFNLSNTPGETIFYIHEDCFIEIEDLEEYQESPARILALHCEECGRCFQSQ